MGLISAYLKQNAVYRQRLDSLDDWGNPSYGPAVTIRVRRTEKKKWNRTAKESVLVDVTEYILERHDLKLGDLLDGEEVAALEEIVGFDGKRAGWTAYMRAPLGFTP